ncbi:type I-E CRISPR-associated endoribonuclease Cas2 [Streptomyces goshikiensis]|uniref:type I-E CRISPR-associated endoribonuclease Cas2 n=1 Tax=Streptomyces goshikiensis TaxID=1942 RepID=UPI003655931E
MTRDSAFVTSSQVDEAAGRSAGHANRRGQVILVEPAANEQGWAVRAAGRDRWQSVDFDGLILSARPRTQLNQNSYLARYSPSSGSVDPAPVGIFRPRPQPRSATPGQADRRRLFVCGGRGLIPAT